MSDIIDQYLSQMRELGATPSFADTTTPAQYGNPYDPQSGLQGKPADYIIQSKPLNQGLANGMLDYGISFDPIVTPTFQGTAEEKYKQLLNFLESERTRLAQDRAKAEANVLNDPLYKELSAKVREGIKLSIINPNANKEELNTLLQSLNNVKALQKDRLIGLQAQLAPREQQLDELAKQLDYYKQEYSADQSVETARKSAEASLEINTEVAPKTLEYFMAMTPDIDNADQAKELIKGGRKDKSIQGRLALARQYAMGQGPSPTEALLSGNPEVYQAAKNIVLSEVSDPASRDALAQNFNALENIWDTSKDPKEWRKYLSSADREAINNAKNSGNEALYEQLQAEAVIATFEGKKQEWKNSIIDNSFSEFARPELLATVLRPNEQQVVQAFADAYTFDRKTYGKERNRLESARLAIIAALKVADPMQDIKMTDSPLMNQFLAKRQQEYQGTIGKAKYVNQIMKDVLPLLAQAGNEQTAPLGLTFTTEDFKPLLDYSLITLIKNLLIY